MPAEVRSAGFVIYRQASQHAPIEFLLLQASYPPHHWTPPKGHVDPGEDEFTAALRETSEEAGILKEQLDIHEDFHETLHYKVGPNSAHHPEDEGKSKSVKYWLARLKPSEDLKLSHEHQNWQWFSLDEAVNIADFSGLGEVFRRSHNYLDSKQ